MRRSNWKIKVLMFVAMVVGVLAGIGAVLYMNSIAPQAAGLAFFGAFVVVAGGIVFIGTVVLRIGRD